MPVDVEKLKVDKRLVKVGLWFVAPECELVHTFADATDQMAVDLLINTLPADGFLCGKGIFADGMGENYGGDGWLVVGMTKHGLLCQTTGGDKPDPERYPGCQFSRCKLAPSALMHVAAEEMQQWR